MEILLVYGNLVYNKCTEKNVFLSMRQEDVFGN